MMHVTLGNETKHADLLRKGLKILGPGFAAEICWWCNGTTMRNFEHCDVCGKGKPYGSALGLLVGGSQPASESVVNQVLVAAERGTLNP